MKKPNMPKKNLERAGWADKCIRLFGTLTGVEPEQDGWETAIGDFLADLRHLCDRLEINFDTVLAKAETHYSAESRCCECKATLKAGDDADGVDCACQKCLKKLETKA